MLGQHAPIVARRGDQEHDAVNTAIPPLRLTASLECLEVMQPRLSIDPDAPAALQANVPRALVAQAADRCLAVPAEGPVETCAEPLQDSELGRIADRRTVRIGLETEVQAEG